jgi:ferredoxin
VGFDVEPADAEAEKLKAAELMLSEINKVIEKRQTNVNLTMPGKLPGLKTAVINPLFNTFALSTRSFFADENCTGCGRCERICPVHTIKVDGRPVWGKACTQCLACIHRCPERAIQFGKGTVKRGRYHHPEIDKLEKLVQHSEPMSE